MVECECIRAYNNFAIFPVLIDTWWNVNKRATRSSCNFERVLIDTWWNVNVASAEAGEAAALVLIDTWWNVNAGGRESHRDSDTF